MMPKTTTTMSMTRGRSATRDHDDDDVDRGPDAHYIAAMLVALDVVSESLASELAVTDDIEATQHRVRRFRNAWLEARRLVARRDDAATHGALLDRYLQRLA